SDSQMPPAAARSRWWSASFDSPTTAISDHDHEDFSAAPQRRGGGSAMLLTIALILAAMIAVAALELWLFWRLGERDDVDASVFVGIEGGWCKGAPHGYTHAAQGELTECQDNVGTVFGRSR